MHADESTVIVITAPSPHLTKETEHKEEIEASNKVMLADASPPIPETSAIASSVAPVTTDAPSDESPSKDRARALQSVRRVGKEEPRNVTSAHTNGNGAVANETNGHTKEKSSNKWLQGETMTFTWKPQLDRPTTHV